MISKINKIKDFGIFRDYTPIDLEPFKKCNIFYGWNGSGKTTLSRLFRCIELSKQNKNYPKAQFQIELDDNTKIDETYTKPLNIRVFNTDFVSSNIDLFNATTEPIIYISEEKIEEKKKLEELKQKKENLFTEQSKKEEELDKIQKSITNAHVEAGKAIKTFLLGTVHADVTYNRATSESIWRNIKQNEAALKDCVMPDDLLQNQRGFILQKSKKKPIEYKYDTIDANISDSLQKRVSELILKNLVSGSIKRLKDNSDINDWVNKGLKIHKEHSSLKCEFCGQPLPPDLFKRLEVHFNDEYNNLINDLEVLRKEVKNSILPDIIDISNDLFDHLLENYHNSLQQLANTHSEYNQLLKSFLTHIETKLKNPLVITGTFSSHPGIAVTYNFFTNDINQNTIDNHNKTVADYEKYSNQAKELIEKHFVAEKAISVDLLNQESNLSLVSEVITNIKEVELPAIETEIRKLEASLKNDRIALDEINNNLLSFIGRNDFVLERKADSGYQLKRNGEIATNLSEGEKTAISLVYFFSKLKENDNKIMDTIIVFDDPISSFDSNHLFSAAHFIKDFFKEEDKKALQLFILTHNFYFFSLINDWIDSKDNKNVYCFKIIDKNGKRAAIIENAENAIKYFNSEYHYLFSEIKKYCEASDKSYLQTHTIANLSRQLLESFMSFKYGRRKLDKCFDEIKDFPEITKVRKFVNFYSHRVNHGDSMKGFNDNVFSETEKLVPMVLKLIEHIDSVHYQSMIARLNNA